MWNQLNIGLIIFIWSNTQVLRMDILLFHLKIVTQFSAETRYVHLSTMSLIVFALYCVGWKECCFHRVFSTNQSTSPGSQHNVLQMSVNRNALPSSRPSLDHLHRQRWCHRHITAQESRVGAWGWQGSRHDLSCSCQHVVYTCRWGGQSRWLLTLQLFSCSWFPHRWLHGKQTRRNSVDI